MELSAWISFLGAAILLTVMPGPDNLFVLSQSISSGKKSGLWIALGLSLGIIVHTTLVATGMSLIIKNTPWLFQIIKFSGIYYLLRLAYLSYHSAEDFNSETDNSLEKRSAWKNLKKGFIMNVLNPKVTLFFLFFLPPFVKKTEENPIQLFYLLGITFMIQAWVIMSSFALLSHPIKHFLSSKNLNHKIPKINSAVLLLIALYLLIN
jgi:threonine/homoserine/homoserine lactone efflux protein